MIISIGSTNTALCHTFNDLHGHREGGGVTITLYYELRIVFVITKYLICQFKYVELYLQ